MMKKYPEYIVAMFIALAGFVLIPGMPAELAAESFRPEGFRYYRDISGLKGKLGKGSKAAIYGRLKLIPDLYKYAGYRDLVPTYANRPLPSFTRRVPTTSQEIGKRKPEVIFEKNIRNRRKVYVLKLPELQKDQEYIELFVKSRRRVSFETAARIAFSNNPKSWNPGGRYALYKYRGTGKNSIRFRSGNNRYLRIEFEDRGSYSFPKIRYRSRTKLEDFKLALDLKDFQHREESDNRTSYFSYQNQKRLKFERLILHIKDSRFKRRFTIERKSKGSKHYTRVLSVMLSRRTGETAPYILYFPHPVNSMFRIAIRNKNDAPLTLMKIEAFAPLEEIIFELPETKTDAKLRLYFGNPYASRRSFDLISTFDAKLPVMHATMGPHRNNERFAYSILEPPLSSWIIRSLFLLGLILLAYPSLRILQQYSKQIDANDP